MVRLLPETASSVREVGLLECLVQLRGDPRGVPDDQPRQQCPRVRRQPVRGLPQPRTQPPREPLRRRRLPHLLRARPVPYPQHGRDPVAARPGRAPPARSPATAWTATAPARTTAPARRRTPSVRSAPARRPRPTTTSRARVPYGAVHPPRPTSPFDQHGDRGRVVPRDPGPGQPGIGGHLDLGGHGRRTPAPARAPAPASDPPRAARRTPRPPATQSSTAAAEARGHVTRGGLARARRDTSNTPATARHPAARTVTHPGEASSINAAVAQAARAGGTSRRSVGPSCRGCASPSRFPESAWTEGTEGTGGRRRGWTYEPAGPGLLMAVRDSAGRQSGGRRCR